MSINVRRSPDLLKAAGLAVVANLVSTAAQASVGGSALPWSSGVSTLIEDVSGPLAHYAVIGALAVTGMMWAFTEHGTGMRKLTQALFGGAVAVGALDLATTLGISGTLL